MLRADHPIAGPAKTSQPRRKRNLEALALLGLGLALIPALTFWGVLGYPVSLIDFRLRQLGFSEEGGFQRCQSCDLQDADLRGLPLKGAWLQFARMDRVRLGKARLHGVHLDGAQLHGADLRGADLSNAGLSMADLSDSDLRGADLRFVDPFPMGVMLRGATVDRTTQMSPGLRLAMKIQSGQADVDLTSKNLTGCNMSDVDLRGRDLTDSQLPYSIVLAADLRDANLRWANIQHYYGSLPESSPKRAVYDEHTRWPMGFIPDEHDLRQVSHDWKPAPAKGR
jgi:uncharacterized protein YjbI with pentapeptide repeats